MFFWKVTTEAMNTAQRTATIRFSVAVVNIMTIWAEAVVTGKWNGEVVFHQAVQVPPQGQSQVTEDVSLHAVQFWWPHTLGQPHLYNVTLTVSSGVCPRVARTDPQPDIQYHSV